jgi:NAD(P)-dependent dehydrogenase (short-subunit alcohol dehydrogenase family)
VTSSDPSAKVGIVTGASRGLGRAIAVALAGAGAHMAVCARSAEALQETAAAVAAAGGRAAAYAIDVTDDQAVEDTVGQVVERFGRLDFLVNNAGAMLERPFAELSMDDWRRLLAINVEGPFLCSRAAVRHMDADRGGALLNVSSIFATTGVPGFSAYAATKAALLGLTTTLAVELAPRNVRVNALLPGHFATDMTSRALGDEAMRGRVVRAIPAGRVGQPDELGAIARFLLSDAATFVTGASIVVDGGFSSR